MEQKEKDFIIRRRRELLENITVTSCLLSRLQSENVIGQDDIQDVNCCSKPLDKSNCLLDIIMKKADNSFEKFTVALDQECQSGASTILREYVSKLKTTKGNTQVDFCRPLTSLLSFLEKKPSKETQLCTLKTNDVHLSLQRILETIPQAFQVKCSSKVIVSIFSKQITIVKHSDKRDSDKLSIQILSEFVAWADLTPVFQQKLLQRELQFQGRTMKLQELCQLLAELTNCTTFQHILEFFDDEILIGLIRNRTPSVLTGKIPNTSDCNFYIPRYLVSKYRVSRKVLSITKNNLSEDTLVFKGLEYFQLYSFVQKYGNGVCSTSGELPSQNKQQVGAILLESDEDFARICYNAHGKPVHLFECQMSGKGDAVQVSELYWKKSHGSMLAVQQFVHTKQCVITEKEFLNPEQENVTENQPKRTLPSFVIINGSVGMGKSVLLHRCAQHCLANAFKVENGLSYTQYVRAREFFSAFVSKSMSDKNVSERQVIATLASISCCSGVGKRILEMLLSKSKHDKKVTFNLFFDGVEELQANQFEIMKDVLKISAKMHNTKIWVTIRPHLVDKLEDDLNVLAFNLKPFDTQNQIDLLTMHWKQNESCSVSNLEKVAKNCLRKLQKISDKDRNDAQSPLLCSLMAKIFQTDAQITSRH